MVKVFSMISWLNMLKLCHKLVFLDKKSFGAYLELPVRQRSMSKKAVFLDRDGTLNDDPGYLSHLSKWSYFLEWVKDCDC